MSRRFSEMENVYTKLASSSPLRVAYDFRGHERLRSRELKDRIVGLKNRLGV